MLTLAAKHGVVPARNPLDTLSHGGEGFRVIVALVWAGSTHTSPTAVNLWFPKTRSARENHAGKCTGGHVGHADAGGKAGRGADKKHVGHLVARR